MSPEHEMANRLEQIAAKTITRIAATTRTMSDDVLDDLADLRQAAALLRRVPTREQKLEALQLTAAASRQGDLLVDEMRAGSTEFAAYRAKYAWRFARKSLRLLGLEDEAS